MKIVLITFLIIRFRAHVMVELEATARKTFSRNQLCNYSTNFEIYEVKVSKMSWCHEYYPRALHIFAEQQESTDDTKGFLAHTLTYILKPVLFTKLVN